MTIQEQLVALITAGATGVGGRLYALTAPDLVTTPYSVYTRVFFNSENVLSGNSGLVNTRMQIDVYSKTAAEAAAIATQIDALMAGWSVQNVSLPGQDFYEPTVKLYRVLLEYSIWHG